MTQPPGNEASLLERCRRGERTAFRDLHAIHSARVHSLALHFFGGDHAAAQDVSQQVFLKLFTALDTFRGESEIGTWLHRIVVNACLDDRRARRSHVPLDEALDWPSGHEDDRQDLVFARRERALAVQHAVASLPPKLRVAILLNHVHDLSYDEMARALDCSAGTVASRLSRGHALLARKLEGLAPTEWSAS